MAKRNVTLRHVIHKTGSTTYHNATRGGPSHGHRGSAHRISWKSVQWFQRYARGQTDRQTDRRVDHNTPHPYRGEVINAEISIKSYYYASKQSLRVSVHTENSGDEMTVLTIECTE